MKITKVWINEKVKRCIACGLCELIAPEVFKVTNKTFIKENVDYDLYGVEISEAIEGCPQDIIHIETVN